MNETQYIRENVKCTVIATITAAPSANIRILEKRIKEHFIDRGNYVRIVSSVSINPHQDGTAVLSFTESNEADTDISGIQAVLLREFGKIEGIQSVGDIHIRPLLKQRNYPKRICSQCGAKMIIRHGKNGPFWGCTNYPKCRHAENF